MSVVANVAINVDAANAIAQLNRVKTAAGSTQKELTTATKAAQGFGVALQSALGPLLSITAALGVVNKAMSVFQDRQADLAVLRNGLNGLVTDVDAVTNIMKQMADEFGKVTLFSEEDFIKGAQMLTSFRSIAVSSYQEVINTAGDVAQVMGTDVNGALLQLAKALQDPVLGLTALSRSGIQFTESQKETIKSMVEAGNAAGAQALILQELKIQYGGAAAAAGGAGLAGAMDTLGEASNDAFEQLGKIIEPALIQGAQLLTAAFDALRQNLPIIQAAATTLLAPLTAIGAVVLPAISEGIQFVVDNIKGFIQIATFIGTFVGTLNAIVLVTQAWTKATEALAAAQKIAATAAAALQALSGPAGIAKVAAATAAAAVAAIAIGKAMDSAAQNTSRVTDESGKLLESVDSLLAKYSKVPPQIENATAKTKDLTAELNYQAQLIQGQIDLEKQRVTMGASLVQARSQAEIAVNNVILQRLEHELQSTTNAQKRAQIIQGIYNLEVANARATYQATVAQITAQAQLVQLAYREQQAKYASLQVELALAEARGQNVTAVARAIELQQQAIGLAAENLQYTNRIASEQLRGADATYQAAVQAAALKAETSGAAQAAGQFASNMSAGAMAVEKAAGAMETVRSSTTLTGETTLQTVRRFEAALQRYEENQAYGIKTEFPNVQEYISGVRAGGFVSPANVSERAQALQIALAKYQAGQSTQGSVNPQVNITTGPVMQMGGARYVTQNDLVSATQSAARQGANMAIGSLRSNPSIRRSVGLAR